MLSLLVTWAVPCVDTSSFLPPPPVPSPLFQHWNNLPGSQITSFVEACDTLRDGGLFPVNTDSIIPLFSFKSLLMPLAFVLSCSLQCPACWCSVTSPHAQRSLLSRFLVVFVSLFSFFYTVGALVGDDVSFFGGAWCLAQWDLALWLSCLEVSVEEIPVTSHWLGWKAAEEWVCWEVFIGSSAVGKDRSVGCNGIWELYFVRQNYVVFAVSDGKFKDLVGRGGLRHLRRKRMFNNSFGDIWIISLHVHYEERSVW